MIFVFLTTSLSTTSFIFYKFTGTVFKLPASKSFTFIFKSFKLVRTLVIFLISSFLSSSFKAIKSFLAAKSDVSMSAACCNSYLVA